MTSPPGANHRQSPPYYQRSPPKNQSPLTPK
uniref:Uncharacterized protein n=1 Tax=Romanomermis culicivorax TaxID=13658 RepID=A0A915JA61_ROMCU